MNNDLISRKALKEEVKTMFCPDGYKIMMLELIDNAPTISDRYDEGYAQGHIYNLTKFELSIIVHVLFKYAEYLKTFKYPYPTVFKPEGIEELALKINEIKVQIDNMKGGAE